MLHQLNFTIIYVFKSCKSVNVYLLIKNPGGQWTYLFYHCIVDRKLLWTENKDKVCISLG